MSQPAFARANRPIVRARSPGENGATGRGSAALLRAAELATPGRLLVTAAYGILLVHTAELTTRVYATSTFVGDDLVGFWLARTLPLREFVLSPIDVHFVPLHRLASHVVYALAPMDFRAGLGLLLAMHLVTVALLHALLRAFVGGRAAAVLVAFYGLHPCLGPLFTWWTSGVHRLGYVLFAVGSLHAYLRYRVGSRWWLCALGVSAACAVGFYSKGALVPLYVLALEASLRAIRSEPARTSRVLAAVGVTTLVAVAYVLAWYAATVPAMHGVNRDAAYLTSFVELGVRVLVPSVFGIWLDSRLGVHVTVFGALATVATASLWASRRAAVAWVALALMLVTNMLVIGASAAKTGLLGFASLLSDRYYFENVFLVVVFGALALRPLLDVVAAGRFGQSVRARWAGTAVAMAALIGLALQSQGAFQAIRTMNYPGAVRAHDYMVELRTGVAALREAGVETISLRDTRVSTDLIALGDLVATNASLLELMGVPVRVSKRGTFVVHSDGTVSRVPRRR